MFTGYIMNKLVYLFELDSVRNSKEEILIGQKALFEEIFVHGNIVTLTYNQVTDSQAFLSILRNDLFDHKKRNKENYDAVMSLFKSGVIRISRYGQDDMNGVRTATQYVLNAIDKCLDGDENAFLFSSLPIKCQIDFQKSQLTLEEEKIKKELESLKRALINSDPAYITNFYDQQILSINDFKSKVTLELKRDYLKNYVQMILEISMENISYNPVKKEKTLTMSNRIEKICELYYSYGLSYQDIDGQYINSLFIDTIDLLMNIKKVLMENERKRNRLYHICHVLLGESKAKKYFGLKEKDKIDNRTNWVNILRQLDKLNHQSIKREESSFDNNQLKLHATKIWIQQDIPIHHDILVLAEAIIDLAYNYTLEASINTIAMHYDENDDHDFWNDFESRLYHYYKSSCDIHTFLKEDLDSIELKDIRFDIKDYPQWKCADHLRKRIEYTIHKDVLYETNLKEEEKSWKKCISKYFLRYVIETFTFISSYIVITLVLNCIQDYFDSTLLLNEYIQSILGIILFGILGSIPSYFKEELDILNSLRYSLQAIKDMTIFYRLKRQQSIAYIRKE